MEGFWVWATKYPFSGFLVILTVLHVTFKIINRFYRMVNIYTRGWPPPYLDADGDHIEDTIEKTDE